ncbi:hypothetical protein R1flu_015136 [Riccia fluitans]|uniref:Uncharacterized protein n=1 Tax=Riccia fluitans TaxID=41844 RepID=A0ABD1YIG9_9MARC
MVEKSMETPMRKKPCNTDLDFLSPINTLDMWARVDRIRSLNMPFLSWDWRISVPNLTKELRGKHKFTSEAHFKLRGKPHLWTEAHWRKVLGKSAAPEDSLSFLKDFKVGHKVDLAPLFRTPKINRKWISHGRILRTLQTGHCNIRDSPIAAKPHNLLVRLCDLFSRSRLRRKEGKLGNLLPQHRDEAYA